MASDATGPEFELPPFDPNRVASAESASAVGVESHDTSTGMALARESVAWIVWTVLADVLIFRTFGLTGPAVFLAIVPVVFWIGCRSFGRPRVAAFCCLALWLASARLVWSGGPLAVFVGFAFVPALALAAAGEFPLVIETFVLGLRSLFDGLVRLTQKQFQYSDDSQSPGSRGIAISVWLPMVAAIAFGSIFVFANPDLHDWVKMRWDLVSDRVWHFFSGISFWEAPFCAAVLLVGAGLLRPLRPLVKFGPREEVLRLAVGKGELATLYPAFRNTLLTVIVLFAGYLYFEFATLWQREFPDGFYYAGYAHEGAAWLTFALALATGTMSLIFSGKMLDDARLGRLKGLAWIWSAENFLLAAAVYNRLLIYVGYNGITRMRTVGFFGITLVVVGVVLVLVKIARGRSFWWLLRSQLVAFALAIAAYSLFPVDYVAHRYNADRVAAGYLHPSVMIAVKPIDDEGVFPLFGLVDTEVVTIREGVRALLAERQSQIEAFSAEEPWHWTRFQAAKESLYRVLAKNQDRWANYRHDPAAREQAIANFRDYALQWY